MSERSPLPPDICFLCLSRERKIFLLPQISKNLFGFLTNWYPQSDARVCWECRAMLERLRRFKVQAKQAVSALERARTGLQPMEFKCLSSVCRTEICVMDLLVYDEPNEYAAEELSDCINECKVEPTEYSSVAHVESDSYINLKYEREEDSVSFENKTECTSDDDFKNDNYIKKYKLDKVEDTDDEFKDDSDDNEVVDRQDNSGVESYFTSDIDTEDTYQHESEQVDLPTAKFEVDAPSSSNAEERQKDQNLKVQNTWAIEKTRGSLYIQVTPLQNKKPTDLKILSGPSTGKDQKIQSGPSTGKDQKIQSGPSTGKDQKIQSGPSTGKDQKIQSGPSTCKDQKIQSGPSTCKDQKIQSGPSTCKDQKIQSGPSTGKDQIDKKRRVVGRRRTLIQRGITFKCDHCDKVFPTRGKRTNHTRIHIKDVMCEQCGYKFHDARTLEKHKVYHLDPSHRPYECHVCHKRFVEKNKLLAHTRIHTGERPFKCDVCDRPFSLKHNLKLHVQAKHNGKPKLDKVPEKSRIKYVRVRPTLVHNKRRTLASLKEGIDYKVSRGSELTTYECNVCNERFVGIDAYYEHYKKAQRNIPCTECDKTFKFPRLLADHMKISHTGEKPYLCIICGATFAIEQRLRVHMASHSNEKPYKCDKCPATFKYQCGVYKHKLIHNDDKPHQCDICEASFNYKYCLVGHMKLHTEDGPYECDICSKKFQLKRNLKNHIKMHSKEQQ